MQYSAYEDLELMKSSMLWQGLAEMDVREKLTIQVTMTTICAIHNFGKGMNFSVKKLAYEKGWEERHEVIDAQYWASRLWTWTLQPQTRC